MINKAYALKNDKLTLEKCMKPSHEKTWENGILDKGKGYWKASDMSGILNAKETGEELVLPAK